MPPVIPRAFEQTGSSKSGFSISVAQTKVGQYIRIGVSARAQEQHFGGLLDPANDAVKIALNTDKGKNHILRLEVANIGDEGSFRLTGGIKGSISTKLMPWRALAAGKRPATELPVIGGKAPSHSMLKLPEWARPEVAKIGQGKSLMDM